MTIRIDAALLRSIAPYANQQVIEGLAPYFSKYMSARKIDTPLRAAHFLAQAAHESAGFKVMEEYASGAAYEGRTDLGNIYAGDGRRFKGHGPFQLTGRANHRLYGKKIGVDLEAHPEKAMEYDHGAHIACLYWEDKGLNAWADLDNINEITRRINGGYNGLQDRKRYLARAKANLGADRFTAPAITRPAPVETVPDAPIAAESPDPWYKNPSLQATGSSFIATIINGVNNPYSLAAIALVVIAGLAVGVAWYRKSKRDAIQFPVGPVL